MLDSLVRVSRRVGDAADLLTTEMRAVQGQCCTRYTSPLSYPSAAQLASGAARERPKASPNFGPALSAPPTVRRVKRRRNAATGRADRRAVSSLITSPTGCTPESLNLRRRLRGRLRLPLHSFTYFWTLSSKFFSTFPHGTCSLSVSGLYLALRGVYHALWAALPSNSTLGKSQRNRAGRLTGLSPSTGRGPSQGGLGLATRSREDSPKHHMPRDRKGRRFGAGLCPFHSPLLGASQLFSFPSLINMLKFGE